MRSLAEIKKEREEKQDQLFKDCGVFWAFSNEQFAANKTPLQEGEKYVALGAGGYCPKSKLDELLKGMKEQKKWFSAEVKNNKLRRQQIVYELHNHEAFHTYDIEDTLAALGSDYTKEEVQAVFEEEYLVVDKK